MGLVTVYDFRYTLTPMRIATYNLYEGAKDSYAYRLYSETGR
jgi:hypothetical protein